MRKRFVILILIIVLSCAACLYWFWPDQTEAPAKQTTAPTRQEPQAPTSFDKSQYSLTDPTSVWVVVNKRRPLNPLSYVPTDLRAPEVSLAAAASNSRMQMRDEAATAIERMFAGAQAAGQQLRVVSAYRSYDYQVGLYAGYVRSQGQAAADAESARAGYSEHQTGLAVDVGGITGACDLEQCFGSTAAGEWVAAHAHEYGFIVRYTTDKTAVTGYSYEPWHLRYIGTDLAAEMHKQGITTLEEFFELGPAPDYQ